MSQIECEFGLTTAEILYRRPDHRWLLQTYIWQDYDIYPKFPTLIKFLDFWNKKLDGPLHSVRVAHCRLMMPTFLRISSSYIKPPDT